MSLTVQISRELLDRIPGKEGGEEEEEEERAAAVKKAKTEPTRTRVNSLSEEDWEERELDDDVFKMVWYIVM